jgi:hypothetical protein
MRFFIGTLIALLAVFGVVGIAVTYSAIRSARREHRLPRLEADEFSLRARIARYVGPVDPSIALLNPPGRVGAEFFTSLCGFPGLGWLLSGSVFTGLVLFCLGPAVVWGFYPVFLVLTGKVGSGPFVAVQYLPGLAIGSSAALAYREIQLARRRRQKAVATTGPAT